jgi:hypothetical protein
VKRTSSRPKLVVAADGRGVVGHAGTRMLADLAEATGLSTALSTEPSTGSSKTSSPSRSRSALRGEREEDAALPVSWRRWTPVIQPARR